MSREYLHRKSGAVIPLGEECASVADLFEQPAHFLDALPVRKEY